MSGKTHDPILRSRASNKMAKRHVSITSLVHQNYPQKYILTQISIVHLLRILYLSRKLKAVYPTMFGKIFQVYGIQFKEKCAFVNQKKESGHFHS